MEWGERAWAVFEALDGAFTADGIVVAVAAVDSGSGPAFAGTEGLPEDARFEIGDPGPVSVSCRSQPRGVAALVTFAGSKDRLSLLIRFTASGQIAMLRFISSDEALPW